MASAFTSRRQRFSALIALSTLALLSPVNAIAAGAPAQRQFSGNGWTHLRGSVPPGLGQAHRLSPVSGTSQISVTVTLKTRDQAGLDQFLRDVNDPASPSYHHFLSRAEFVQRFGPDTSTRSELTSWLTGQGLHVVATSANGLQVTANGSVTRARAAFNTPIYSFKQGARTFFANTQPVRLPDSLASDVVSVSGLSTVVRQAPSATTRATSQATPRGLSPSDIQGAYDTAPLINAGTNGAGQTIAIAGFADYSASNIAAYDQQYGLPNHVTKINVSDGKSTGGKLGDQNGQGETEMDIELIQASAPQASVLMYEAPNTSQGALRLYNQIVSENRASVITTSWGSEESTYTSSEIDGMHQILQEAAAQGQSFFAASGDNGAYDGATTPGGSSDLSVDYPASDPWATGVGGTTLDTNNGQYLSEVAWSDGSNKREPIGSGGGLSTLFSRPSYQTGPGVDNSYSNGMRQVPDVALNADPATGYAVYTVTSRGGASWGQVGGTSASSPVWAGFALLLNQGMGRRVGSLNPTLYDLGQRASTFARSPFHDVTQGDNLFYPATPSWDFSTGWGSFDGDAFLADLRATGGVVSTPAPVRTATPSPTQVVSTVKIAKVILLHKVNGKLTQTSSLKVGETGTLIVTYTGTNLAGRSVAGSVEVRQNGTIVKTVGLKATTYNGRAALTNTVKFTSRARVGTLQARAKVTLGSLTSALTTTLKLVAPK